ncbi:hypothetical protein IAU60_005148 [Kwoniella sp. DSM 27419]
MSRLRRAFGTPKSATANGAADPKASPSLPTAPANPWEANDVGPSSSKHKDGEMLFGFENFGNTCYCNSVMQALYACEAFKRFVESYPDTKPPLTALGPPPGKGDIPLSPSTTRTGGGGTGPLSPGGNNKANPFDSPALNNVATPLSPGGKDKRGWTGLGRRTTNNGGTLPTLGALQQAQATSPQQVTSPTFEEPKVMYRPPEPDPNQAPPSVFQTIQTLFFHLTNSPPHQPAAPKPNKDANGATAQTASLLPVDGAPPNTPGQTPAGNAPASPTVPQGPPLLASLPPPSAPRSGGPWQAGKLGRGVVRPEDLLRVVKRENEMFRGMSQQDAHEFLGWLLNQVAEEIEALDRHLKSQGKSITEGKTPGKTFVQSLFEGVLTNETRCLSCETTSERDESFLDLSIDIEQHTSVTACLRQFSASEMLCQKNKFYCDSCCGLQEAEKRMKIKRLPNILALHLKRFKYQEATGRYGKLFYRVPFPTQLRLPNTTDDMDDPDRLYELFSVVVHIGNGPHHGHYVTLVRSNGRWVMCDDENIEPIDDDDLFRYFGDYPSGAGYVLFYQAADLNLASLGLKLPTPPPEEERSTVADETPSKLPRKEQREEQLIDLSEEPEKRVESGKTSPRAGLRVDIPPSPETPVRVSQPSSNTTRVPPPVPPARQPSVRETPPVTRAPSTRGPAPPPPVSRSVSSRNSISAHTPPVKSNGSTPTTERQLGFNAASAPLPASATSEKDKDGGKWLSRVTGKDRRLSSSGNGFSTNGTAPPSAPSSRPSTAQTTNTTTGSLGLNMGSSVYSQGGDSSQVNGGFDNGQSPAAMSSSVMSTVSAASASTGTSSSLAQPAPTAGAGPGARPIPASSQVSPPANAPSSSMSSSMSSSALGLGLGRKASMSASATGQQASGRDRTVSSGSTGSANYAGGGSLGRKLSGMGGKLGRSGSMAFGKFGLGKKDKDKGDKDGIREEQRREEERKGLLG